MKEFSFEATGTQWTIVVDQDVDHSVFRAVQECAIGFERRFSRFKVDSEIGKINAAVVSELEISDELAEMLVFGKELQELTDGYFDVNVASVLEGHGYDAQYSFRKDEDLLKRMRGEWSVRRNKEEGLRKNEKSILMKEGLVKLDLGAFGKGRLIDNIAKLLNCYMVEYYLVDGGRDFYGTSKSDGSPWMIALEHPFDASLAIGEFALKNCALACSGISQRKVKDFHHFIDTKTGKPVEDPVGVFVSAERAMVADGVSTAIAVSPLSYIQTLEKTYAFDYAVVSQQAELLQRGFEEFLF